MTDSENMLHALEDNDLVEAELSLEKALKNDPQELLEALGEELYHLGFIAESKRVFSQLLKKVPDHSGYLLSLGELAIEEDDYDTAFAYFDQIKKESPDYPAALLDAADLYQLMGIPEVAEEKLKEALRILPGEPLVNFALGELYFSLQRFMEAASYYLVLQLAGEREIAGILLSERLGVSYAMAGEFEKAITPLQEALKTSVTDDRLFYLAYTYQQLKENQRAITFYEQLETLNPEYVTLYLPLGKLYEEDEELEKAQETYEKGLKEDPFNADLYLAASSNAYRLFDTEKAISLLEKALETGEKEEDVVTSLSHLYLENEEDEKVIALYEDYPKETPSANWDLGKAYYHLEDFDQAFKFYTNAYAAFQNEPEFMKEYGLFLREEGHLPEAKQLLTRYVTLEPEDLEIVSLLESFD